MFDKYGGRVLLGEPGAGKTTTLMAFARDAVWKRLENSSLPLPILAPIATWGAQKQTPLAEWLAEAIPMLKREDVARLIAAGNGLLMLDGLDELGGEREDDPLPASPASGGGERRRYDPRQRFLEMLTLTPGTSPSGRGEKKPVVGNQVVVTCRVKDYKEIGEKIALKGAVTLQALDDEQMREYLREMPDLWAALEADNDLREVARTPLLLSLFTYAFAGLDEEAKKLRDLSRGDLRDKIFETYVRRRYEHEERKLRVRGEKMPFTLEEIYEILGRLAIENICRGYGYKDENVMGFDQFFQATKPARTLTLINIVTNLQLIVYSNYEYSFIQLLLRDHLAFRYALTVLLKSDEYEHVWSLNDRLVALFSDENPAKALGFLKDARAVEPLIAALKYDEINIRWNAAEALGRIRDSRAVPHLIELFPDTHQTGIVFMPESRHMRVCDFAADALERIGTPEALEAVARWRREQGEEKG